MYEKPAPRLDVTPVFDRVRSNTKAQRRVVENRNRNLTQDEVDEIFHGGDPLKQAEQ